MLYLHFAFFVVKVFKSSVFVLFYFTVESHKTSANRKAPYAAPLIVIDI